MKISYLGNFSQQHCTETHIALTLEKLGHEVVRIQESQSNTMADIVYPSEGSDLFLWTRTTDLLMPYMLDILKEFKKLNIPTASYHLDLYIGLQREDGLDTDPFWQTDYVFTPDGDPASQKVFEAKGINHYYMKPGVFEDECYIDTHQFNKPNYSVVFVGGGEATGGLEYGHKEWSYRGQLIKFLQDTYDDRFSKFGHPQETIRNEALNELYANTKVVVGDSLCLNFNHPYYWSDRVYETLGRGGFIIHPYIKGMEEEFTDGENIVFYEYNNWTQLKEKIDYYLEHNEEREKIRLAGQEFVKENATYHNRLRQMLSIIANIASEEEVKKATDGPYIMDSNSFPLKISLGAGLELEDTNAGWVNVDLVDLPGIQVVHNLMDFPYPFADNTADYIKAKDLIEHLANYTPDNRPSVLAFVEECHRILKPGGILWIQTPSWDAEFMWIDPTHVRGFDIRSFDFFDPDTDFGRSTGFYSPVKFKVTAEKLENRNLQFTMVKL